MKIEEHVSKLRANRRQRGVFKERKEYSKKDLKWQKKAFKFFSSFDQFG